MGPVSGIRDGPPETLLDNSRSRRKVLTQLDDTVKLKRLPKQLLEFGFVLLCCEFLDYQVNEQGQVVRYYPE